MPVRFKELKAARYKDKSKFKLIEIRWRLEPVIAKSSTPEISPIQNQSPSIRRVIDT